MCHCIMRDSVVDAIRRCHWPQYVWDRLPLPGAAESILRLDHIQPIGRHYKSYEQTPHCLSTEAMEIIDEWVRWHLTGCLSGEGTLFLCRDQFKTL